MKCFNKLKADYAVLLSFISCMFFMGSCNIAYQYDIESGTEDDTADSTNVTIVTGEGIDVSMYESARIFPGLVDTLVDNTVNTLLALDLSKRYIPAYDLDVQQVPRPIYSTGLYAGAGELITITINDNTMGLTVIIGSHLDDLTDISPYLRLPVVTTSKQLFPGKNTIRNPLGGMIWIEKSKDVNGSADFVMEINGAYRSPDFIVGSTDVTAWVEQLRTTTVPWLELRGRHVAFSVQRERLLDMINDDPSIAEKMPNTLEAWDNAVETYYYNYYSLQVGAQDFSMRAPDFPERVVLDVELLDNLYIRNADYGVVALNTNYLLNELASYQTLKSGNSIAIFNALYRNYSFRDIKSPWWSEVSDAVKAIPLYRMAEKGLREDGYLMGPIFPEEGSSIAEQFPKALAYADTDSSRWFVSDIKSEVRPTYALASLVQLANYKDDDWAFYIELNRMIKDKISVDHSTSTYFFKALCDYFKEDFSPFFEHWGYSLTDEARSYASKYPLMDKAIWKYSPLAENPSSGVVDFPSNGYHYRHNRADWEIYALDANGSDNFNSGQSPDRLLDSDKSTGWTSYYNNDTSTPPLPYYLFIDMKETTDVNGVFLAGNNSDFAATKLIIETPVNQDIINDPLDENIVWREIVQIDSIAHPELPNIKSEGFYDFPSKEQVRYLRIKLPEPNRNDNWNETDMSRFRFRVQSFTEFGTFYYKP